jgi:hypothetical protein
MRPAVGFFKDLRKLNKMGKESYLSMDVDAQLAQANVAMSQAQDFLTTQTAALQTARDGEPASATITAVRPTGMLIDYQPVVEVSLLVTPEGGTPYPATMTDRITVENRLTCVAGREVQVAVDPDDSSKVWIDWAASTG